MEQNNKSYNETEVKKKHQKIKKELIDLINKLNDDEREILIHVIKNIKEFESTINFLKKITK